MGGVAKAIGGIFGAGGEKPPKPPEPVAPPPAATPPTLADASGGLAAAQADKGRRAAGAMMSGTVLTSPQGLKQKASTAKGSLLSGGSGAASDE